MQSKKKRIKKGIKSAFLLSGLFSIIVSVLVYIFARDLKIIFVDASEMNIITIAVEYLRIEGMFYILIGWLFLLYGYYRGNGKAWMSFILTIISLETRVILSYSLSSTYGLKVIWMSIVIGWAFADVVGILYYFILQKSNQ